MKSDKQAKLSKKCGKEEKQLFIVLKLKYLIYC